MPKDQYKEPITFVFPKMIARVYIPILDPLEKERRIKNIHRATTNLMKGVQK